MIKPDSNYLKSMPEQYFTVPKGQTVNSDVLAVVLERIDFLVELMIANQFDTDTTLNIAYLLESSIYQAREMALRVEVLKNG